MHAAVRFGRFKPASKDEAVRRIEEEFLPMVRDSGLVSYYLVDAGDDSVITVSVFESEEAAHASNQIAQNWVKESLAPLMAGPLDVYAGNVLLHEGN